MEIQKDVLVAEIVCLKTIPFELLQYYQMLPPRNVWNLEKLEADGNPQQVCADPNGKNEEQ
eukprot:11953887-Karenia_brevis.AAC.1